MLLRLLLISGCLAVGLGAPANKQDVSPVEGLPIIISAIVLVTGILLTAMCVDYCRNCMQNNAYKDFDNPEENSSATVPPDSDFSMYPPVESTPVPANIAFEPLPDLEDLRRRTRKLNVDVNLLEVRPNIVHEQQEKATNVPRPLSLGKQSIARENLQYVKDLSKGWFGQVVLAEGLGILPGHKKTKVVVQQLKEDATQTEQLIFAQQVLPYCLSKQSNIIRVLGQCQEAAPYLNILEYCALGDLKAYLRSHQSDREMLDIKATLIKVTLDMLQGLCQLQEYQLIHRDFGTRNCLVCSDLTVKVGDYGTSETDYPEDYYCCEGWEAPLPIRWLPPECVHISNDKLTLTQAYTPKLHVWSWAVALWEVFTMGDQPYREITDEQVLQQVLRDGCATLQPLPENTKHRDKLLSVLDMCLCSDPKARPNLADLRLALLHLQRNLFATQGAGDADSTFDMQWHSYLPIQKSKLTALPISPHVSSTHISPPIPTAYVKTHPSHAAEPNDEFGYPSIPELYGSQDSVVILEGPASFKGEPAVYITEIPDDTVYQGGTEQDHDRRNEDSTGNHYRTLKGCSNINTSTSGEDIEHFRGQYSSLTPAPHLTSSTMVTSTPKHVSDETMYHTAYASMLDTGDDGSMQDDGRMEERNRFKAMLQTVVTSFDDDEYQDGHGAFSTSFEGIPEEDYDFPRRDTPGLQISTIPLDDSTTTKTVEYFSEGESRTLQQIAAADEIEGEHVEETIKETQPVNHYAHASLEQSQHYDKTVQETEAGENDQTIQQEVLDATENQTKEKCLGDGVSNEAYQQE